MQNENKIQTKVLEVNSCDSLGYEIRSSFMAGVFISNGLSIWLRSLHRAKVTTTFTLLGTLVRRKLVFPGCGWKYNYPQRTRPMVHLLSIYLGWGRCLSLEFTDRGPAVAEGSPPKFTGYKIEWRGQDLVDHKITGSRRKQFLCK